MKTLDILSHINLSKRLDIVVKILYIESLEKNKDRGFYRNLYLKHIEIQTGFLEDTKKSAKDFLGSFQKLINSIKKEGFKKEEYVCIGANNSPITGAHRIACCIYFNKDIYIEKTNEESGISWDIEWFTKNNFSQKEILSILHKYKELSGDFLGVLWPSCNTPQKIKGESLRYKIKFPDSYFVQECIFDIYSYEKYNVSDIGISNKAHIISDFGYFHILLFKHDAPKKEILREKLMKKVTSKKIPLKDKKFFTFHCGDDKKEDRYLQEILLSDNYFFHLFKRQGTINKNLLRLLEKAKSIYTRDMCIVGSGPLGIYNISKVSDLDLIEKIPKIGEIKKVDPEIDILDYEYTKKHKNIDIIEKYFFYWRGFKFINLPLLTEIKGAGLRKKDSEQYNNLLKFLGTDKNNISTFSKVRRFFTYYKTRFFISCIHIGISLTKKIGLYEKVSYYWRKYVLKNIR